MIYNLLDNKLSKYIVMIFLVLFGIKALMTIAKIRKDIPSDLYSYEKELSHRSNADTGKISQIIEQFYNEAKMRDINISIKNVDFSINEKENLGVCYWNPNLPFETPIAKIALNPKILTNDAALKTTIFHELSHCILGLEHNDETLNANKTGLIPISIMHSYDINDVWVYNHFNLYIEQLFTDYSMSKKKKPLSIYEYTFNHIIEKTITPLTQAKSFIITSNTQVINKSTPAGLILFNLIMSIFFIINIIVVIYQLTELPIQIFNKTGGLFAR